MASVGLQRARRDLGQHCTPARKSCHWDGCFLAKTIWRTLRACWPAVNNLQKRTATVIRRSPAHQKIRCRLSALRKSIAVARIPPTTRSTWEV